MKWDTVAESCMRKKVRFSHLLFHLLHHHTLLSLFSFFFFFSFFLPNLVGYIRLYVHHLNPYLFPLHFPFFIFHSFLFFFFVFSLQLPLPLTHLPKKHRKNRSHYILPLLLSVYISQWEKWICYNIQMAQSWHFIKRVICIPTQLFLSYTTDSVTFWQWLWWKWK